MTTYFRDFGTTDNRMRYLPAFVAASEFAAKCSNLGHNVIRVKTGEKTQRVYFAPGFIHPAQAVEAERENHK